MVQLARELKTLARDLSVAVLVRKWAWPAMLAFSLVPGLHQVGRCSFQVLFISLKQQLLSFSLMDLKPLEAGGADGRWWISQATCSHPPKDEVYLVHRIQELGKNASSLLSSEDLGLNLL